MLTLASLILLALLIGLTVRGGIRDTNRAVEDVRRDRLLRAAERETRP